MLERLLLTGEGPLVSKKPLISERTNRSLVHCPRNFDPLKYSLLSPFRWKENDIRKAEEGMLK